MKISKLQQMIDASESIVFFGGAGVSTESGIPDYRSVDGLYNQQFDYPPETMLSHDFFFEHTEEFFDFYRTKMLSPDALPNAAHKKLAELEASGKLKAVITQNVDGLHQAAGSKNVVELHGSVHRNRCLDCGCSFGVEKIYKSTGIPRCKCGGIIKPQVVLYGEDLGMDSTYAAVDAIADADMLIIGGTSLTVYPAAGFLRYFKGSRLAVINKTSCPVPYSISGYLEINEPIGKVLGQISV